MHGAPAFLVSIDTEGDDVWARPRAPTTRNARFLPRFQALCEAYGWKPTWLVNWEMAHDDAFVDLARDALARGACEVGMHLHAWGTPPAWPLTRDDAWHQPYLVEYPEAAIRAKVARMTEALEQRFERKMVTHRAGRWALDVRYARALIDAGYLVDTSVTPHVSWRDSPGAPWGRGGTDYTRYPEEPYFLDVPAPLSGLARGAGATGPGDDALARPARNVETARALLEIPMTIAPRAARAPGWIPRAVTRALPAVWLRPRRANLGDMVFLVRRALREGRSHVQLMLHSSELMPGGSPTFRDEAAIERMYEALTAVFELAKGRFRGATFAEARADIAARWTRAEGRAIQDRVCPSGLHSER